MMATVLTRLMPTTPSRLIGRSTGRQTEDTDSAASQLNSRPGTESVDDEEDAEDVMAEESADPQSAEKDAEMVLGEQEASESSVQYDSGDEDDDDTVVPPKRNSMRQRSSNSRKRKRIVHDEEDEISSDDDDGDDNDALAASSNASSSDEPEWQAEEGEEEDLDQSEVAEGNRCTFCKQLEDDDPGEEFELILACSGCGDNAHRQCARDAKAFSAEEDADDWKCPNCVDTNVDPEPPYVHETLRRTSAPKIARDLLPAQKAVKAGSHSVFNTLILDDDPMDGSRSLRKRKISNEAEPQEDNRKKQRRGSSEVIVLETSVPKSASEQPSMRPTTPNQNPAAVVTQGNQRSRSGRLRQPRKPEKPLVSVIENDDYRFVLSISLKPANMYRLLEEVKRKKRRARDQARHERQAQLQAEMPYVEVSHYPAIQSTSFTAPFFAFHGREGDEAKSKPYGGILSETEADNTKTFPQPVDRKKFESARLKAEDEWRRKIQAAAAEQARTSQKVSGPPTRIKCINFGRYEIDTWHSAPYPEEYSRNKVLYICEFCLKYMNSDFVAWRHKLKCPARHPPGDEIYHDGSFSFFEVDGRKNPVYCQNLCLLAKLFLGSKTLYYDVEPFLFYVMTENNDEGCHFVGYFSKEKRPSSQNNVSCILVLPIHQRRGFGHMLIEFSYLLTRVEGKTGSPEKPLSDMGLVSYRNYWRRVLCSHLLHQNEQLSISDISDETGMTADDIVCALEALRALVRDPVTKTYALRLDYTYFKQYLENYEKKGYAKINPEALTWVPYVMGRDNSHYENAPRIQTVAQRGDDSALSPPRMPEEGVQLAANGVSEKDFSGSRSGGSVGEIATPREETEQNQLDTVSTPFPSFESNTSRQGSPSKRSHSGINPSTPVNDAPSPVDSPIPPTRFEVFPPLPGSTSRKRSGRSGPRGASRRGTPLRRRSPSGEAPETAARVLTMRRGRSKLADMVDGSSEDVDATQEQHDEEQPPGDEDASRGEADGNHVANGDGEEDYNDEATAE